MHRYSPAQIDAIESFRESPYCSMCGCYETELAAMAVVRWLTTNGNRWDIVLPQLDTITTERNLKHSHGLFDDENEYDEVRCDFPRNYITNGMVNEKFIDRVHRSNDGMRLTDAALCKLRPDLFPETTTPNGF